LAFSRLFLIVFDQPCESPYFSKVESRKTTKRKTADDEIVDFEITCNLEPMQDLK